MRHNIAIEVAMEQEPLVDSAVNFAANLLRFSDTFFPFGLISVNGDIQSVFTEDAANSEVQGGMIEEIEWGILELGFNAANTFSIVVYAAQIESVGEKPIDVIATKIIDSSGAEIMRLYPFHFSAHQVNIDKPIIY